MSNAKSSSAGYYLKLALTLLVISAVVSGLLGLTNYVTADKIAAINADKTAASMQEVLPADRLTELDYPLTGSQAGVAAVYQADDKGYVVEVTPSGFGGTIDMVVGVDMTGAVTGVSIISMSETSVFRRKCQQGQLPQPVRGQKRNAGGRRTAARSMR